MRVCLGTIALSAAAEKLYETRSFVEGVRVLHGAPHVIQNQKGTPAVWDLWKVRHAGHRGCGRYGSAVEGRSGRMKQYGLLWRPMLRVCRKMDRVRLWKTASFNILRIASLEAARDVAGGCAAECPQSRG